MEKLLELCDLSTEHIRIRNVLIEVACRKEIITYSQLIDRAKIKLDMSIPYDRGRLGQFLGEISWNEVAEGRPMLSSVALHRGGIRQGQGFFDLAERLYTCKFKTEEQKLVFGMNEIQKVHNFWSK